MHGGDQHAVQQLAATYVDLCTAGTPPQIVLENRLEYPGYNYKRGVRK